ncbi:MAG: PilN domain-containing protein [Candidatus Omnitrophota bacterium]
MIAINLLPRQMRKAEKKIVLPYKTYLLIGAAVLVLLHILLFGLVSAKKIQVTALRANLNKISSEAKDAVKAKNDVKAGEERVNALKTALSRRFSLTELLSGLSESVPKGLWMERFSLSNEGMILQGTVVSLSQNEMTIIGRFLQGLKANKTFEAAFTKIELASVQRRSIKTYDVVDYVLQGEFKK